MPSWGPANTKHGCSSQIGHTCLDMHLFNEKHSGLAVTELEIQQGLLLVIVPAAGLEITPSMKVKLR